MKKIFAVLALALIAVAPVVASADTVLGGVGYAQGQQNQILAVTGQAQLHGPFGGLQVQGQAAGNAQDQATINAAGSSVVSGGTISVFGFPVLSHVNGASGQAVAGGRNTQGQQVVGGQSQFAVGGIGVQGQLLVQSGTQVQQSAGSSAYLGTTILP